MARSNPAAPPAVSVVMPTYKRDDLLARCLRALITQELPGFTFEIIVVDDAQSSTAPRVVAEIAATSDIPIVCLPGRSLGPATARNIGWRAARGRIIAFIDDDAYPEDSRWLAEGLAPLGNPAVAAVTGRVIVPTDDPPSDFQRNVKHLENAPFLTCNAFVRRSVLEALDGFDERFRVAYREDSDLQFRIEATGATIVKAPRAVVIHPAPNGRWGISLRLQRYSMYNALIYKKHPRRYPELQRTPPFHYYAMLILAAASVTTLLLGQLLVAATLIAGGIALWLAFLLRRIHGTQTTPAHIAEMALTSLLIPPLAVYWRLRGALHFRVLFI